MVAIIIIITQKQSHINEVNTYRFEFLGFIQVSVLVTYLFGSFINWSLNGLALTCVKEGVHF